MNFNATIIISSISFLLIQKLILNKFNYLIIILIIFSTPQLSIYHQYFEPLIYFFIFFEFVENNDFKINYRNICMFFLYLILFLTLNIFKNPIKNFIL